MKIYYLGKYYIYVVGVKMEKHEIMRKLGAAINSEPEKMYGSGEGPAEIRYPE